MSWLLPPLEPHFDAALRDVHAQGGDARLAAARRLARPDEGREAEARQGLRQLMVDPQAQVRAAALEGLSGAGLHEHGDHPSIQALLHDRSHLVREWAVIALSSIEHPQRIQTLRAALEHAAPEVRFQALQALTYLAPADLLDGALARSRDPDSKVREAAVRALGAHNETRAPHRQQSVAESRLRALLRDADPAVAWEAALVLAPRGVDEAADVLITALQNPTRVLDSLDALSTCATTAALAAVRQLAQARFLRPPLISAAAGRTLLHMGDRPAAVSALRRALLAIRSDGRNHALETVASHRIHELGAELAALARFPRGADRQQLVQALVATADNHPKALWGLQRLARRAGPAGRTAAGYLASRGPSPTATAPASPSGNAADPIKKNVFS